MVSQDWKKAYVKADLAIHGHVVDVSGQWMSVSLTLGLKLEFNSCGNLVSFHNNYVHLVT